LKQATSSYRQTLADTTEQIDNSSAARQVAAHGTITAYFPAKIDEQS
jgi:hypothetical protein